MDIATTRHQVVQNGGSSSRLSSHEFVYMYIFICTYVCTYNSPLFRSHKIAMAIRHSCLCDYYLNLTSCVPFFLFIFRLLAVSHLPSWFDKRATERPAESAGECLRHVASGIYYRWQWCVDACLVCGLVSLLISHDTGLMFTGFLWELVFRWSFIFET